MNGDYIAFGFDPRWGVNGGAQSLARQVLPLHLEDNAKQLWKAYDPIKYQQSDSILTLSLQNFFGLHYRLRSLFNNIQPNLQILFIVEK